MAKFHARPSLQYRYEHYDPVVSDIVVVRPTVAMAPG